MVSFWTQPFLNFWIFMKKYPCRKNKTRKKYFDKQVKLYLKMFRKKRKGFKANWVVLAHSKPKIFSVGQPWWPAFIWDLAPPPPTILVLLRPWEITCENVMNKSICSKLPVIRTSTGDRNLLRITECSNNWKSALKRSISSK